MCQRRNKNKLENILKKIMKTRYIKTCQMQLKQGLEDVHSLKVLGKKTENQYTVCLSLYDLFHLAQCPQDPSMLSQMASFLLFHGGVIFHCLGIRYRYILYFLCPFIHQWTLGSLPRLGCINILTGFLRLATGRIYEPHLWIFSVL